MAERVDGLRVDQEAMSNPMFRVSLPRRSSRGARCLALVAMAAVVLSAASCACSVSLLEVHTEVHMLPNPTVLQFYPRAVAWTEPAQRVDRPTVIVEALALRDERFTDEQRESDRSRLQALVDKQWASAPDPVSFLFLEAGFDREANRVNVRGLLINATGIEIEGFGVTFDIKLLGDDAELFEERRFEIAPVDLGRMRHGEGVTYTFSIDVGEVPLDRFVSLTFGVNTARDIWVVPYG